MHQQLGLVIPIGADPETYLREREQEQTRERLLAWGMAAGGVALIIVLTLLFARRR